MAQNINRVILTGNLTRDPELKSTASNLSICNMRLAVNGRVKREGEWVDRPGYYDVVTFGAQADNCSKYLSKGRPIALDGRLDWREWTTDDGSKRQAVQIIADSVQFLSSGDTEGSTETTATPPATTSPADDDIPF